MRAETRHQLKEDRFSKVTLQAAEQTVHWSEAHKSKLVAASIAAVLVAAIGFGGWYYMNTQDEKASVELSSAGRVLEEPIRPAGVPEQPGYPSFASSQDRATASRKLFQAIIDKYPHTHTADMARYFVGLTSSQLGDNAAAEKALQEVAQGSNKDVAALARLALASVYAAENKGSQAVDTYKQLIENPTLSVSKVMAQLELAGYYANHQKPDEAKRIYDQIQKENPATEAAQLAQQKASKL